MIGHLGINVPDLVLAQRYYDRLMPLLGMETFLTAEDQFAYRPADGKRGAYVFFYPALERGSRHQPGLQHVAFMVKTRAAVERVHELVVELVLELGGEVVHEPREFPEYPPPYYATFWLDPFGFLLEAVCHYDA